jgi:translin
MHKLESIAEQIRQDFDTRTANRDQALAQARQLTRACSLAIRAVHRDETDAMQEHLDEARKLAGMLISGLAGHPDLYFAGYTQDALKEFVEASVTCALIRHEPLQTPAELGVTGPTYLNGLAEVVGELRRRTLDILRHGYSQEAERLLGIMDDIYSVLVTMDYPDAITNGLRRQTDLARGIIEKTRGDVTFSLRGEHLEQAIGRLSVELSGDSPGARHPEEPGGLQGTRPGLLLDEDADQTP